MPAHLEDQVRVGSIVRVPLSGRRVRGYVVETAADRKGALKPIAGVSSDLAAFTPRQLRGLEWAANYYVAPVSVMLDRAAPPNLPKPKSNPDTAPALITQPAGPLVAIAAGAARGQHRPATAIVGMVRTWDWLPSLGPVLHADRSVMVVVSTTAEVDALHRDAEGRFGERAIRVAGDNARELTGAWVACQGTGRLVIGTPRLAAWAVNRLALAIVLEEGRRAMKDRQTPTIHVRDLLSQRGRLESFSLVFIGPTPSLEALAAGAEIVRFGRRSWSLVEVVDRRDEAPGSGFLSERCIAALRGVTGRGGRSLVFTHRRAADASLRCVQCRTLRLCASCGSRLSRDSECRRCGTPAGPCTKCGTERFEPMGTVPEQLAAAVERVLGPGSVGLAPARGPITVGTERDLTTLPDFDLVVVADADGLAFGQDFRAREEALRVLGRLGTKVAPGSGRRMMIQTSAPESDLITTMRSGDPIPFLDNELARRALEGLPPSSEMMALELRGLENPTGIGVELKGVGFPNVMGPAVSNHGFRWLIHGDLGKAKLQLRPLVQTWRDRGITVRVDVDPIDL